MADQVLLDTSIIIPLLNEKKFQDSILDLNRESRVLISIVTANELIRGAHDSNSRSILDRFFEILRDGFLVPSELQWLECARISEKLLRESRRSKENVLLLQNDLLIALGARDAGATLVTNDKKDFGFLKPFVKVPIEFW
jgi:predicted nucleic acid-binding protein